MSPVIDVNGKSISCEKGDNLLSVIRNAGVSISSLCAGRGICAKCRVQLNQGVLLPTPDELKRISAHDISNGIRLACLHNVDGDLSLNVLNEGNMYIQTAFNLPLFNDFMDKICPSHNYKDTAVGIAVDIGTTTVAAYFFDLSTNILIDVKSVRNPQYSFGGDVISRISYIREDNNNLLQLHNLIIDELNRLTKDMCIENKISEKSIKAYSVTGNTVMLSIFSSIDPSSIGEAPFTPPSLFGNTINASKVNLLGDDAKVYIAHALSGYVGGDIMTGLIACGAEKGDNISLFIDIGTNAEIALVSKDGLLCCSAAAGPALEGAGIECGIGAVSGAIDAIIECEKGYGFTTINDAAAKGICGSGLISAAAYMLRKGIINESGAFTAQTDKNSVQPVFMLNEKNNIYISQKDIRQLQLAKAAIAAGISVLIEDAKIDFSSIENVYIAGGFGNFIDIGAAAEIGLIPKQIADKAIAVGNAAAAGAIMALLSKDIREEIGKLRSKAVYIELSDSKEFQEAFIINLGF